MSPIFTLSAELLERACFGYYCTCIVRTVVSHHRNHRNGYGLKMVSYVEHIVWQVRWLWDRNLSFPPATGHAQTDLQLVQMRDYFSHQWIRNDDAFLQKWNHFYNPGVTLWGWTLGNFVCYVE